MQREDVERDAIRASVEMDPAALLDRAERAEAALAEMTRRRDTWREKAKDVDVLRAAVRAGIKEAGPANLSRIFLRGALAESERRLAETEAERDAAFAAGLQSAVAICKRVRSEVAENEAEATGALECAIAIMDEVNDLAANPRP